MVRRLRGKQAVYLVTVAPGWKPQSLWSFPDVFAAGEVVAKNLIPSAALGYARTHNKRELEAIQHGHGTGKWALVAKYIRPKYHADRHSRRTKQEGGSP